MATSPEIEDRILREIFCVTVAHSTDSDSRPVYLETTAAEILKEGKELLLSRDLMERVLEDRLSGNFSAAEPPLPYLLGCYRRAYDESKKIQSMTVTDENLRLKMENVTKYAKNISVSYIRIQLGKPELSDKPSGGLDSRIKKRNFAEVGSGWLDILGGSPPGFVDEFWKDLYDDLRYHVLNVSVIGDFEPCLRALNYLVSLPVGAKSLVSHEWWVPLGAHMKGRAMELNSILGPFFHISALPDNTLFKTLPDVG